MKKAFEPVNWRAFEPSPVIGVDEVGRGCLAGPVYAGAAILNREILSSAGAEWLKDLTDSKLLTEARREQMAARLLQDHQISIAFATEDEIAKLNIFRASLLAMKRAVLGLGVKSGHCLVDGKFIIPDLDSSFRQTAIIKGDLRAQPISAAAICAKVARDHWMKKLSETYPVYGFSEHKGYATPSHKDAIVKHGPCSVHRVTFSGVKEYLPPA